MRLPGCSLSMTVRHRDPTAVGRTQASIVMPVVRSSTSASATVTQSLTPSKLRAPPNLPAVFHVGPFSVPVLPRPDASAAVVPDVSSKPQAPIRLLAAEVTVSVTAIVFGEPVAPAVVAVTVTVAVYVPAASPVTDGLTESVAGAVALAGVTVSHDASSDAVTSNVPPPVFVTDTVCAAGFAPPCTAVKARLVGETDSAGGVGGSTVSVTGMVFGEPVAPVAVTV